MIKITSISSIVVFTIIYLCFSFLLLDYDFRNWEEKTRIAYLMTSFVVAIVFIPIILFCELMG